MNLRQRRKSRTGEEPAGLYTMEALEARVLLSADVAGVLAEAVHPPSLAQSAPSSANVLNRFQAGQSPGQSHTIEIDHPTLDRVSITLSGPGSGQVWGRRDGTWSITVDGTTNASTLKIAATQGGKPLNADIVVRGDLAVFLAPTVSLTGKFTATGSVGSFALNTIRHGVIEAPSLRGLTILGDMVDTRVSIHATSNGESGVQKPLLGSVYIRGSVMQATIQVGQANGKDGHVGFIHVGKTVSTDSRIQAALLPQSAGIGGTRVSTAEDPRFQSRAFPTSMPPTKPATPPPASAAPTPPQPKTPLPKAAGPGTTTQSLLSVPRQTLAAPPTKSDPTWDHTLARWKSNMLLYGEKYSHGMASLVGRSSKQQRLDSTYYDAERVYYQIAQYTGDSKWLAAARLAEQFYRDELVLPNDGRSVSGYFQFTNGLLLDYQKTGDARSREAIVDISRNAAYARDNTPLAWTASANSARDVAYALMSHLNAEQVGAAPRPRRAELLDQALSHLNQLVTKSVIPASSYPAAVGAWIKPFFVGLTLQSVIAAHELTGDARIQPAVGAALDALWQRAWLPGARAFYYESVNPSQPAPDLNLLIAPAYAWMYKQTGNTVYRDRGDQVFKGGVEQAYLGTYKHFNQNYMWSVDYVKWRQEGSARYGS